MKYTKPPLTFEEQADLLLSRGMACDRSLMIERLAVVNYYRLSGYWFPFRDGGGDAFKAGTTFERVWTRYVFDRQLRCLVMDAIERVEVAVRASLAYYHSHYSKDPFAYATDVKALPNLRTDQRDRFLAEVEEYSKNSKEAFAEHFRSKYGTDHAHMPIWMASEIMTFGHVVTFFRGSAAHIQQEVAKVLCVHDKVAMSWLLALNTVRNACAHHARLWNRAIGTKPLIPKHRKDWHVPVAIRNDRAFGILTILKHCIDIVAPQSGWCNRLVALLEKYNTVPQKSMGFPDNWKECPIWKKGLAP